MLSLDQIVFFLVLAITIDSIILVHLITLVKGRKSDATEFASFMIPMLLFFANFIVLSGLFGSSSSINLSPVISQYIASIQSSVAFAFILALVSTLFVAWSYSGSKNKQFLSYSLLFSHLSILLLAISLTTGLISPSIIPSAIQDYSGIGITALVGIAFEYIDRKGHK
jgi:hypothetical protein